MPLAGVELPAVCVATGPAVGGVAIAVLPQIDEGQIVWWESGGLFSEAWGPARRALRVDVVLSRRPLVFDDALGEGPTAILPLTLERYERLVLPRFGGPSFGDQGALESWFLGRTQLTA